MLYRGVKMVTRIFRVRGADLLDTILSRLTLIYADIYLSLIRV